METYLTVMFWLGVWSIVVRSVWLVGEHPRTKVTNIGSDVFGWALSAGFLVWVSYLKFWA